MKVVLSPHGSAGDVFPLLWLGKILKERGHEVVAITLGNFAPHFERLGIRVVLIGTEEDFEEVADHPDLWHPKKGFEYILSLIPEWTRKTYPAIASEIRVGETLLIGSSLAYGARIANELYHVPYLSSHLQPCMFMSAEEPPVMVAEAEWMTKLPRWIAKGLFALSSAKIDSLLAKPMNAFRAALGLKKPVSGMMKEYWMSPDGVLALFPDWFGRKMSDWPEQTMMTRFPLYDTADSWEMPGTLEKFLDEGDAPLIFTPGSANKQARSFFDVAVEVCVHLGRKGVFVSRYPEQIPDHLPNTILHVDYAPFSRIFPRGAAVVHHGGVGTVAQCFAAGVPQFIMAMSHDQPDNGYRVRKMGVGDYVYPKDFRSGVVSEKIVALLKSSEVAAACEKYRKLSREQISEDKVAALIENAFRKASVAYREMSA